MQTSAGTAALTSAVPALANTTDTVAITVGSSERDTVSGADEHRPSDGYAGSDTDADRQSAGRPVRRAGYRRDVVRNEFDAERGVRARAGGSSCGCW